MKSKVLPQLPTETMSLVVALCGVLILALLAIWLRRRGTKDSSLVWICLSLLSFACSPAINMLPTHWLHTRIGMEPIYIRYIFSPISNIFFTKTAFRLYRVQELFRNSEMKYWPAAALVFVSALSIMSWVLIVTHHLIVGKPLDAIASCVSLTILGFAIAYSFGKYGNPLLAGLTIITITSFNALQFIEASDGPPVDIIASIKIANLVMLIMLFIALTVAWGLSDTSRLKTVGIPVHVNVIAMFFDLRGSTKWSSEVLHGDLCYVGAFVNELHTWAWKEATTLPCGRPSLIKFLGDGFMFVWEASRDETPDRQAAHVAKLACSLVQQYPVWAAQNTALWRGVPGALGAGVDAGPAIRLTFENGSEDYIGAPLNMAAKMQDMARPSGGVLVRADIGNTFDAELRALFPTTGHLKSVATEQIIVFATEKVEIPD